MNVWDTTIGRMFTKTVARMVDEHRVDGRMWTAQETAVLRLRRGTDRAEIVWDATQAADNQWPEMLADVRRILEAWDKVGYMRFAPKPWLPRQPLRRRPKWQRAA